MEIQLEEYVDMQGRSPFQTWFNRLNSIAAAKVSAGLYRLQLGYQANIKRLGDGIWEYKIHYGPGYRIYFGKFGNDYILLLGGGSKKTQSRDIEQAKLTWKTFKHLRKQT